MKRQPEMTTVETERLRRLQELADVVFAFLEDARYIDAHFNQHYTDMATELRALGYQVRDDIPLDSAPAGDFLSEYDALLERFRKAGFTIELTSPSVPVQLEGHLPTGEAFYFRSRHTTARLAIAPSGEDPVVHPRWEASFSDPHWGMFEAGVLRSATAEAIFRELLGRYQRGELSESLPERP